MWPGAVSDVEGTVKAGPAHCSVQLDGKDIAASEWLVTKALTLTGVPRPVHRIVLCALAVALRRTRVQDAWVCYIKGQSRTLRRNN